MCHNNDSPISPGRREGFLDVAFPYRVKCGSSLVKYDQGRVLKEDPGKGDSLPLAARKILSALQNGRIVPAGHRNDLIIDTGHVGSQSDCFKRSLVPFISDVLAYRS